MAKQAIYLEEARRLYVQEGLSLDAITGMLGKNVSRKTLYNWKQQYEWDAKRKDFLEQTQDLKTQLIALAKQVFNEAKANPTQKNIKRMLMMLAAVEKYGDASLLQAEATTPDQKEKLKNIYSPELLEHIRQVIYGLK